MLKISTKKYRGVVTINIGEKIKKERLKRQWTQEQLGKELNVSRSAVSSWEVGRNYPDLETIVNISDLLDISLDQLLREDKEMTKNITQKTKMNKYYKITLIIIGCLFISYLGFNMYLRALERKYHHNLLENNWEPYSADYRPAFNQFELKEEALSYYTNVMPTGFIGIPLKEHQLRIITRYKNLVTDIKDSKDIEILMYEGNDPTLKHFAKVKVTPDLDIVEEVTPLSKKDREKTQAYLNEHRNDYQKMIKNTLEKLNDIKK